MSDSTWGDLFRPFRPHWRILAWCCAVSTALGILLAFVLPARYIAITTLLPPTEDQTGLSLTSLLRGISVPGVRVAQAVSASDLMLSVLESDWMRRRVGGRVDLCRVYSVRDTLDAREKLRRKSKFKVTPLGVIEIRVEAPQADDAARLANTFTEELDRFVRTQRMTKGHRTRVFIERRMADVRADLDSLQHEFSEYERLHHAAALGSGMNPGSESGARLFAERLNIQFQLELAKSYSAGNSQEVSLLEARLGALDKELDRLPPVGMGIARLLRELKGLEGAYAFLSAQYEDARIEEARDVVALEVLDAARPPRKPSWPKKKLFAAASLAVGLLSGVSWVAVGAPGSRGGRAMDAVSRSG
ncbi:MAG: hypothetical protein HZB25_09960 [Candidatus Eisenbacteria bacterium]|nr:hypothetical protein [Candidatus Eisenbacteria bacterium]